ncbi:hypothetical protein [Streptomyces sp. NPDC056227]|uniref:hypothetical protein n=1 Tax=Streptomyces sp. NPDC056227 TaxID=3345753 RepID=UPI0035DEADE1
MTTTTEPTPAIAVRTCAAILRGDKICLIHRHAPAETSTPSLAVSCIRMRKRRPRSPASS